MKRLMIFALLALAGLVGCVGDPSLDGPAEVHLEREVHRADWQDAAAGCEDVDATGMTLAACEGEPLLGALVDGSGVVACVDSLGVLLVETGALPEVRPAGADPSPQPSHPGMPDMGGADAVGASTTSLRVRPSDGETRSDPTPTPVTEPLRADPTPTPVVQPEVRDDPTPTPIMRD